MKNRQLLIVGIASVLTGCFGSGSSSSGTNNTSNTLTVVLDSTNAPIAARLSLRASTLAENFFGEMVNQIPSSVLDGIETRTEARVAGVRRVAIAQSRDIACSGGGKAIEAETDTSYTLTFENCAETEGEPAVEDQPAYSRTTLLNGTFSFIDSTMEGYSEAVTVAVDMRGEASDSEGEATYSTQRGSFVTGYSNTGNTVKDMNMTTRYWGKLSTVSTPHDFSIATTGFSIVEDYNTSQKTLAGNVSTTGVDEFGKPLLGGSFHIATVIPVNDDLTLGEYNITGANGSRIVTRLDPLGLYIEINGGEAKFEAWDDTPDYFAVTPVGARLAMSRR